MSKRIAIFNHKGGTGKTISAYHIGWKLTEHGHNVLLVDGDSQVNLTALKSLPSQRTPPSSPGSPAMARWQRSDAYASLLG